MVNDFNIAGCSLYYSSIEKPLSFGRPNYNSVVQRKRLKVSCKKRPCPCLESDPDFCEVLVEQPTLYQRNSHRCIFISYHPVVKYNSKYGKDLGLMIFHKSHPK